MSALNRAAWHMAEAARKSRSNVSDLVSSYVAAPAFARRTHCGADLGALFRGNGATVRPCNP